MNVLAPAGDLDMSAKDLLSYLEKTAVPQDSLRKEVIDKILEPTAAVNADLQVGKGWHISNNKEGQSIYWHNGGTYGFSSFVAFIRGRHQAVVVVANRFDANQVTDGFGMRIVLNYFRQDYWYGH
jgi:CubicO group peptidase (beta-lactamase class C family)